MISKARIKSNPVLKQTAGWMLNPPNDPRPRWWVRTLVNPLKHKVKRTAIIRNFVRLDVFPFNNFTVGAKSIIEDFAVINNGVGDVEIGSDTIIGIGSTVIGPVKIGDNVMLAQHVAVSGLNHGYEDVNTPPSKQPVDTKPIIIMNNVWIGANAVITAGVSVGYHSIVGAGSVVTKDVPDYSIAVGNPARVVKKYNFETQIWEPVK